MTGPAQSRTVVVTGAAGFIGSHLVDRLLNDGHVVVGIDRRDPTTDALAAVNLTDAMSNPRFTLAAADLTADNIDALLGGVDTVFHLAAVPGVRPSWGEQFPEYLVSNILGTFRLVGACVRTGVRRVVYASSSSVYGIVRAASREHDMTMPASPYGITKLAAEQMLLVHSRSPDAPFPARRLAPLPSQPRRRVRAGMRGEEPVHRQEVGKRRGHGQSGGGVTYGVRSRQCGTTSGRDGGRADRTERPPRRLRARPLGVAEPVKDVPRVPAEAA